MSDKLISQYDEKIPASTDFVLVDDGSGFYNKAQAGNLPGGGGGGGAVTLSTPSLTATPSGSSQINLSWTNVANETNYELQRSPNGSTGWTTINSPAVNVTSYNDTGLTASTAYYYRIRAIGNGTTYLNSGYGSANATTGSSGATQLSTPGSFAATPASSSQINLSWTDVANESSYSLEWSPNGSTGWTAIGGTIAAGTTSFNHTGLTASTAYYYRLKAVGNGTTFTDSNFATANATTSAGSSFVNITSWTSLTDTTVSSNNLTAGTTATAKAVSTNFLAANTEGRVRFTVTKVGGKAGILALSETTAAEDYTQVDYGIYVDSNNVGYITPETATVNSGVAATDGDVLEIERKLISGNYRLLIKHSTNGGTSFTTIYTSTTFNANILYVKFTSPFYDAVRCDDIKGENIS